MKDGFDWVEEARKIAEAEVDRAVGEFRRGEDVRFPCYSSITDGRTTRNFNGELRVIYPARISQPDTMRMRFEMTLNLEEESGK